MIKYIKYTFLLVPLFLFNFYNPSKSLVKNEKPIIKRIKTKGYSANFDINVANKNKAYILYEYDRNGNLLKQDKYNQDGNLKNRDLYQYDKFGNQIQSDFYSSSTRINTYSKSDYVYDEKGKIMTKHHESGNQYKPKKFVSKTEYVYENENLTKEIRKERYLEDEETITKLYKYNTFNAIDSIYVHRDDHLYETTAFKYNDKDILLESIEITYPIGGNPEFRTVLKKFDAAEHILLEIATDSKGYYYKKIFKYNEFGMKTNFQEIEKDEKIISDDSLEYTLDKHQNWIICKSYSFGESDWISEREIEYYN